MARLTDTKIRALKPAEGKTELLVADGNGLSLRIRNGARTWQFRRKHRGRVAITTLGSYPAMSLKEARFRAAELSAKRQGRSATVEEVVTQWRREIVERTHKQAPLVVGYLDRAVLPDLGGMRIAAVQPSDIADSVRRYRDRVGKLARARSGGQQAGRSLLTVYKSLFRYAVASGWIATSPAGQLSAAVVGEPAKGRNRVLDDDELRAVMTSAHPTAPVLRFLLATGCRLGEAYAGHREGEHWVVPTEHSKNGRRHDVWLSEVAREQLEHHPWAADRGQVQRWATEHAGGWTAHDVRRSFATRLSGMGVPLHVVERALNHTLGGMLSIYNQHDYEAERRDALERWSERLLELRSVVA